MKSTMWDNMTAEEQAQETQMCRDADALEAAERRAGYTSDSDYD